jgi:hypothetical protein
MSALKNPIDEAPEVVHGGSPFGGATVFDLTPYGSGSLSGVPSGHAPIPTGGLYMLVSGGDTSIERIGSIGASTWAAIESQYLFGAGTTEPSETLAGIFKRLTAGQFLAALMVGAGFQVPSATPVVHTILGDPFAPVGHLHAEDPEVVDHEGAPEDPEAYRAFKDLRTWLSVDDEQVADMLGIGRTTPYAWKREGHEPRPETARRIYEYYAVLDSLRRRLGPSGFHLWLRDGRPPRRERLLAGELEALDRDVHSVLFRPTPDRRPDLRWAPEPTDVGPDTNAANPVPRRASRRPRRARLK